jgi:hypothetical protein
MVAFLMGRQFKRRRLHDWTLGDYYTYGVNQGEGGAERRTDLAVMTLCGFSSKCEFGIRLGLVSVWSKRLKTTFYNSTIEGGKINGHRQDGEIGQNVGERNDLLQYGEA